MLLHYFKIAFRNMWKRKTQTLVCIGGLTIGFVVFAFCVYWLYYELNSNSQFPDYENIFFVNSPSNDRNYTRMTLPFWAHEILKKKYSEIEAIEVCEQGEIYVATNEQSPPVPLMACTSYAGYLDLFPPEMITGTHFQQGKNNVVLSRNAAISLFGTIDVVGKSVALTDDYHGYSKSVFTVCGIMENPKPNSSMQFEIFVPFPAQIYPGPTTYSYWTYLKVKKGVDRNNFYDKLMADNPVKLDADYELSIDLVPIHRAKYMGNGTGFFKAYGRLIIIALASVLLLLCALFNYIILSSMQIMTRTGECAMRRTIGASKTDIACMFFMELTLVMLFTLALSLILFAACHQTISQFANIAMPPGFFIKILLALWSVFFAVSALTGIYPLWLINKQELGQMIKRSKGRIRKILLIVQLTIGVIFLFSLLEISRQFRLMTTDLGFNYENVLRFRIPQTIRPHANDLVTEIESNASVSDALWVIFDFFSAQQSFSTRGAGRFNPEKKNEIVYLNPMQIESAEFFGLKMVEGEFFKIEHSKIIKVVVNQKLVEQMELKDVVGKRIDVDNIDAEIIGVVKDFHDNPLNIPIYPRYYVCPEQFFMWGPGIPNWCYVKYLPGMENEARQAISNAFKKLGTTIEPAEIGTYNDYIKTFYRSEKQTIQVFSIIAAVCLIICSLGVYAMVNLTVQQRRREIAIRKVAGAETSDIVRMLLKEYLLMVVIACAVALPPAYMAITRWLQNYAYHINIGMEVILVVIVMVVLTVLVVFRKSYVAANSDPAEVVKYE